MTKMLVAGVGNIFLSDDGFGTEVLQRMAGTPHPDGVRLADFGIRGVHLAYELLDGDYDTLVLVDASPHGRPPGTVSLLEVDPAGFGAGVAESVGGGESVLVDAHGMEPGAILSRLGSLGGTVERVLVVACEPLTVEEGLGLSDPVRAAIPQAITLVEQVMTSGPVLAEEVSK